MTRSPKPGKKRRINTGRGYAWLCDFGLCHWVEPDKRRLMAKTWTKPSPEAEAVAVRIIRERDWRRIKP